MKKLSIIAASLALLMAMTQCKKEEQPTSSGQNNVVSITLDIKGNGGTRMDVNTTTGEVAYATGDIVYVASGGHYVGTLTHNGTHFSGTITDPEVGAPLHFYFLGNVAPAETLTAGTTTTCSVVISDQTEHLPVIEYAPSNETYSEGVTSFTSHLLNKCALVKFNVTTSSEVATCITGFNNKVTVDFGENTVTPSQEGTGIIKLPAGSGEKWAILLPQEAIQGGSAYSEDDEYSGTYAAVPAVINNGYLTTGIDVTVTVPVGAISGKFTINAEGDQVWFSQGNLQYIGSAATPYWKFAENQWDYLGTSQNGDSQTVDRDLFGWGTSGYHDSNDPYNTNYYPYSTSTSTVNTDYNYYGYGPSTNMTDPNLVETSANYDWGVYNDIKAGDATIAAGTYRTLTRNEWTYVFNTRSTTSGIRYAKAQVNNVNGVVLLPDNWTASIYALNNTNTGGADFTSNAITAEVWTNTLEANGAVFLPAAGYRSGASVRDAGSDGYYWSSSYDGSGSARDVYFGSGGLGTYDYNYRSYGFSVRLVRSAR